MMPRSRTAAAEKVASEGFEVGDVLRRQQDLFNNPNEGDTDA